MPAGIGLDSTIALAPTSAPFVPRLTVVLRGTKAQSSAAGLQSPAKAITDPTSVSPAPELVLSPWVKTAPSFQASGHMAAAHRVAFMKLCQYLLDRPEDRFVHVSGQG